MQEASAPLAAGFPTFGYPPLDDALAAGLLIEAGLAAAAYVRAHPHGPRPPWVISDIETKRGVLLTPDELARQLSLIRWFIEAGRHTQAIDGMRAWVVNRVMQRLPWDVPRWLARDERAPIEHFLDSLAYRARNGYDEPGEGPLASIWDMLRGLQGALHDCGVAPDEVVLDHDHVEALYAACMALNACDDPEPLYHPPEGRLVITPLGLAPGVLYAVARLLTPSHTLIVTSEKAREREVEALTRAAFPDLRRTVRVLEDPFHCFGLAPRLAADPEIRALMLRHDEVVVNVTGGTTAMQFVVERLWRESRALGKRTARAALIDRRDPAEQMVQPYVEGELVWLDDYEEEAFE